MDLPTVLVVMLTQLAVLVLFVWVLRYSNKRMVGDLAVLEKQQKEIRQAVQRLESFQKELRRKLHEQKKPVESTQALDDWSVAITQAKNASKPLVSEAKSK